MNPTPITAWYAVYTKPGREKKIAYLLTRKGFEIYCPQTKVPGSWPDHQKWAEEPLFTSFVFIRMALADQAVVRKTNGVINFLYWLDQPVMIREEEITAIKNFLHHHHEIKPEKCPIRRYQPVEPEKSSLMNKEGNVPERHPQTTKLHLPTIGFTLIAMVGKTESDIPETKANEINHNRKELWPYWLVRKQPIS